MGFNGYINQAMEPDDSLPVEARSSHASSAPSTYGIKTQEEFNEDFNYHKSKTNCKFD